MNVDHEQRGKAGGDDVGEEHNVEASNDRLRDSGPQSAKLAERPQHHHNHSAHLYHTSAGNLQSEIAGKRTGKVMCQLSAVCNVFFMGINEHLMLSDLRHQI